MIKVPPIKYNLSAEEHSILQSLIGQQLWRFWYNDSIAINCAFPESIELMYNGTGIFVFKEKELVTTMNFKFSFIKDLETPYEFYTVNLIVDTYEESIYNPLHNKLRKNYNQVFAFSNIPVIQKIEMYGIRDIDHVYEYYDRKTRKDIDRMIDLDIDLFLVFYFSNGTAMFINNLDSSNGFLFTLRTLERTKQHIELKRSQHYEKFNLVLKKVFL